MIRVYRAKQIGTGTYLDPYRPIIQNFVDVTQGDTGDSIDFPAGKVFIYVLNARQSVHDAIVAYKTANPGTITYLSTLHTDMNSLRTQYNQQWSSLPLAFRTVAEGVLGVDGLIDYSGTIKQVFKRLISKYLQSQRNQVDTTYTLPVNMIFNFGGDIF